MSLHVIILAAGKGSRMKSDIPKVLHKVAGMPMLHRVLSTAKLLAPEQIHLVLGHGIQAIQDTLANQWSAANIVRQAEQLGTGHAVNIALDHVPDDGISLVLYGDVPLITAETLEHCVAIARAGELGIVTANMSDPAQLGRILRNETDSIEAIVEHKDATQQQRAIHEINSGILAAPTHLLRSWLAEVQPSNQQGEYYLTDVVALAVNDGVSVQGIVVDDANEVIGVNDRVQLSQVERILQRRQADELMRQGVTFADPERVDIRGTLSCGTDCFIDVNTVFIGDVHLASGVVIGPSVVIESSQLGAGAQVKANTVIEGAMIAEGCQLGPFARIRPGSQFASGVKIGNFVETKKTTMGAGSKASHLAYLGDAVIGMDVNVGAGSVTCNYDGVDKHPTTIGDGAFVGTNSTLVAPLTIGAQSFVAAGSTVTADVEEHTLALGRVKQRNIARWLSPLKRKQKKSPEH
ncbi:MAG: UDP-N-acetylglucosamine diphosphorylase/glucosamine-1-phosphate N-acetyltransferase [Gammaproteobacteria bacterium]|nr:UDP-N-acetylglucosamine diphosphorylase/glucosamine-1-phosphate N-acetyltransferase [Gammaproteobacteria bacterium]